MEEFQVGTLRIRRVAVFLATLLLLSPFGSLASAQSATPIVSTYVGGASILLDCSPSDQCQRADRQDVFSVEPGNALRAEFGFVHSYPEPKEFRVFLLLNYQQSPFSVQRQEVHEPNGLAPLGAPITMPAPGTVTAPDDPGIHQLFVQQFSNRYVDVAVADETGQGLFGESSQRLILNVR